jgi:predicted RNA methylase
MENLVLFGTGDYGKRIFHYLKDKNVNIICFLDNDMRRWNEDLGGVPIVSPDSLSGYLFDAVVICVSDQYHDAIYTQLRDGLGVPDYKIRHWTYWMRTEFLNFYHTVDKLNEAENEVVRYVEKNDRLFVFNYDFVSKYAHSVSCVFDDECGMYYGDYNGRRLYLKKSFNTKDKADTYFTSLMIEQDKLSPHRYLDDTFSVNGGIVLDAGAAEGNFALEVIEKVDKVILVEADKGWNEALLKTFEPWKEKVLIINKYLSDKDDEVNISIDTIAEMYNIDFIKMDIEGAEVNAVIGGTGYLNMASKLKMALCVYHNHEDEDKLREVLGSMNYNMNATYGYMVFIENMNEPPRLVHGVLKAER